MEFSSHVLFDNEANLLPFGGALLHWCLFVLLVSFAFPLLGLADGEHVIARPTIRLVHVQVISLD